MFKIGCSVAKKILAIDKNSSSPSSSANAAASSTLHQDDDSSSSKAGSKKHNKLSKQQAKGGNGNNSACAANKSTAELDDFSKIKQDPRMPLNVRQMFKITKSWKAITRTMSKTGTAMFLNLFEQNEDLFNLFERFKHLKGSKNLHESIELREHAATVMSTLDQSISSLSDYDNFVSQLHSIGKLHQNVPDFKREYFWRIEQPFLTAVKQTLDERFNESIEEIYKVAIKLIIATIADGYSDESEDNTDEKDCNQRQTGKTCPRSR